jgi:hypothetical protein
MQKGCGCGERQAEKAALKLSNPVLMARLDESHSTRLAELHVIGKILSTSAAKHAVFSFFSLHIVVHTRFSSFSDMDCG